MPFKYETGEEIRKGDRVTFHGEQGEIEVVAEALAGDPALNWYVTEFGGGVMVVGPKSFGHVFLAAKDDMHGLEFVSRSPLKLR